MKKALVVGLAIGVGSAANAQITMNIFDDGTDMYMTATGDYDMSNATVNTVFSGLGVNAVTWASFNLFGWETDDGNQSVGYDMVQVGTLSGADGPFGANFVSGSNGFFTFGTSIYFDVDAPIAGSVDELARYDGVTLASLGMIVGETATFSWGSGANEGGTINVTPAPASLALVGLGGLVATRRRR